MEQSGSQSSDAAPQASPPQTDAASRNILVPIDEHEVMNEKQLAAGITRLSRTSFSKRCCMTAQMQLLNNRYRVVPCISKSTAHFHDRLSAHFPGFGAGASLDNQPVLPPRQAFSAPSRLTA